MVKLFISRIIEWHFNIFNSPPQSLFPFVSLPFVSDQRRKKRISPIHLISTLKTRFQPTAVKSYKDILLSYLVTSHDGFLILPWNISRGILKIYHKPIKWLHWIAEFSLLTSFWAVPFRMNGLNKVKNRNPFLKFTEFLWQELYVKFSRAAYTPLVDVTKKN